MKWLDPLQRHLGLKLFVSYLVVILVLIVVIVSAAIFVAPGAFERHLTAMQQMTAEGSGASQSATLEEDLLSNFRVAVTEALRLAALAAFLVAIPIAIFVSRRIVAPVRSMMLASQHIAEGYYDERVQLPGGSVSESLDELGQLALSFNQMADKLQRTEEMRRQLIGDVAHELRTPLTTIQGSMEGLLDGVLPATEETYDQVLHEATRLQKLVQDLQELSRVEADAFVLNPRRLDVLQLVSAACARLTLQFQEKDVELRVDVDEGLPGVQADEDRIGQVLLNLLGNGLQYTPAGGWVRVSAAPAGEFVEITVEDSGIGLAPENLPHIFTRFYRVDKSRSRVGGGSGVGLTIARRIVEASGGRIHARSPGEGKGSTFIFSLPRA